MTKRFTQRNKRKKSISIKINLFDALEKGLWKKKMKNKKIELSYDMMKYKDNLKKKYKQMYNIMDADFNIKTLELSNNLTSTIME